MDTHPHTSSEDLVPISEAARILGVSAATVRRWDARGVITSSRPFPGSHRRFRRADLTALLDKTGAA